MILLIGGGFAYLVTRNLTPDHMVHTTPDEVPSAPLPVPTSPPAPDLRRVAADRKRDGLQACADGKWNLCVEKLQAAGYVDPAVGAEPAVTKALDEATRKLDVRGPDPKGPEDKWPADPKGPSPKGPGGPSPRAPASH